MVRCQRDEVQWVLKVFTSTYQTTTNFSGGLDLGIISFGAQSTTTHTLTTSISVNTTTGFTAPVPSGMTFYAAYGVKRWHVTGTYFQEQYECGTWEHSTVTSGTVNVYRVMSSSQGWVIWQE